MQKITHLNEVPAIAAYLARIGATPRSIKVAVVEDKKGKYWDDRASIRFDPKARTVVATDPEFAATEDELKAIQQEMGGYQWPASKLLGKSYSLPDNLKGENKKNIFEFRDQSGQLVMLQHRTERSDRGKYRPWTYFDDGEWRMTEPDGLLPLWGMEFLKDHTTVFIHEGAKAARACHRLIHPATPEEHAALKAHPWGVELSGAAHLGWIGGALNPERTDWEPLVKAGVKLAYIVADNDDQGRSAVPRIAKHLRGITTFSVEFNKEFPDSFDLADPWPEKFFREKGGLRIYKGPRFDEHLQPATWATHEFVHDKKKIISLRSEFKSMWCWIKRTDQYVCIERPTVCYSKDVFDGYASAFCHAGTKSVAVLLRKQWQSQVAELTYRPDKDERIIGNNGEVKSINLFAPTRIQSLADDPTPWLEFMNYLFPDPAERHEMLRWCATLVGRPDLRMSYAALLVSETQGVGKNTLGEKILAPLVGMHNCSFPNERDVVESQFNSWLVNKRFAFIGEIYTGRSWKAANLLKSHITDRSTQVNEKYVPKYTIENWIHIMACSNSLRALKLDNTDRRWFVPTLTETPWPHRQWVIFNDWIEAHGLSIIKHWAETFGDYVKPGEHAPMTERKREMQTESESEAVQLLRDWCEAHADVPMSVADEAIKTMLQNRVKPIYESKLELRRVMEKLGWQTFEERLKIDGVMQAVMMSPVTSKEKIKKQEEPFDLVRKWIRSTIKLPVGNDEQMQ